MESVYLGFLDGSLIDGREFGSDSVDNNRSKRVGTAAFGPAKLMQDLTGFLEFPGPPVHFLHSHSVSLTEEVCYDILKSACQFTNKLIDISFAG